MPAVRLALWARGSFARHGNDARSEPFFKATGFYLRGLPPLVPTNKLVPPRKAEERSGTRNGPRSTAPAPGRIGGRSAAAPSRASPRPVLINGAAAPSGSRRPAMAEPIETQVALRFTVLFQARPQPWRCLDEVSK